MPATRTKQSSSTPAQPPPGPPSAATTAAAYDAITSNGHNFDDGTGGGGPGGPYEVPIDPTLNDMNAAAALGAPPPPPGPMQGGPPLPPQQQQQQQQQQSSQQGNVGGPIPGPDDGDNRTRNAKAQRRHREKRKAHLKALEESVTVLTAQLEDARRQLGQAAYYNSQRPGGPPHSPQSKDFAQLQAENAYLRDENADLRRQLYSYRMNYGHPATPGDGKQEGQPGGPGGPGQQGGNGNGGNPGQGGQQQGGGAGGAGGGNGSWEVKPDQGGFGVYGTGSGGMSPRRGGDQSATVANPATEGGGPSSASSSSGNYPPMEHQQQHFTPIHQRSRSRNMSNTASPAQGGPPASPFMQSDGRPVDPRYATSNPNMTPYDPSTPVYPTPPLPSVGFPPPHHYTPRPDGEQVSWPQEGGPPPFTGYPLNFGHGQEGQPQPQAGEEWRPQEGQ